MCGPELTVTGKDNIKTAPGQSPDIKPGIGARVPHRSVGVGIPAFPEKSDKSVGTGTGRTNENG
jgi:hypothetical protein